MSVVDDVFNQGQARRDRVGFEIVYDDPVALPAPGIAVLEVHDVPDQLTAADTVVQPVAPARPRSMRPVLAAVSLDASAAVIGTVVALAVAGGRGAISGWPVALVFPTVWVLLLWSRQAYRQHSLGNIGEEARAVGHAGLLLVGGVAAVSYVRDELLVRDVLLVAIPVTLLLTLGSRLVWRELDSRSLLGDPRGMSVVVVGHAADVEEFARLSTSGPCSGAPRIVGACLVDVDEAEALAVPCLGSTESVDRAVAQTGADAVVVLPAPATSGAVMRRIVWSLQGKGVDLFVGPGLTEVSRRRLSARRLGDLPLLHVDLPVLDGGFRWLKAVIDRLVAVLGVLLLAPLFAVLWVLVRADVGASPIFRQTRVGRDGKPFVMFKFRTMAVGTEEVSPDLAAANCRSEGPMFKLRCDPRVTRLGKVLRRFSLDELPQVVNVLRGDMSLVGPRPPLPGEVAQYEPDVHRRLLVKPGLTGLWQVSGRSDLTWEDSVRLDLRYVDNWSLGLDLAILLRTVRAVCGGSGAY